MAFLPLTRHEMTYDAKSLELAEHFLQDVPGLSKEDHDKYAHQIAKSVQRVVEDELEAIATARKTT
jgi:Mn-dependent DtxR family transcriptional regulator